MLLTLSVPLTAFAGDGARTPIPAANVEATVLVIKSRRESAAASSEVAWRDVTDLLAECDGAKASTENAAARERMQSDSFILDKLDCEGVEHSSRDGQQQQEKRCVLSSNLTRRPSVLWIFRIGGRLMS